MKTSNAAVHYQAAQQQKVSKKTALAVVAGAIALACVLFAISH